MDTNNLIKQYIDALSNLLEIDVVYGSKQDIIIKGEPRSPQGVSELDILNRIGILPGRSEIISLQPKVVLRVQPSGEIKAKKVPWTNIVLFGLTLVSTILVGAANNGVDYFSHPAMIYRQPLKIITGGMSFSFSLLGILLFHEFGHYTASRLHGVKVTLPYFIPFPNIIGTLGAVIRSKSPFVTRKQLLDVGAAGPLSGMIIAIPVLIWGISHPSYMPESMDMSGAAYIGESLLFMIISAIFHPAAPQGFIATLSPVAFAGWVGLLVTMLNLLPIGQLDGGHIMYALFGKMQRRIANFTLIGLVILSFFWVGWIIWALLGYFLIRASHPPTVMDEVPLDSRRKLVGYLCILVFILCFIPVPFRMAL